MSSTDRAEAQFRPSSMSRDSATDTSLGEGSSVGPADADANMSMSVTFELPPGATSGMDSTSSSTSSAVGATASGSVLTLDTSAESPTLLPITDAGNPLISPVVGTASSASSHDYASAGEGLSESVHNGAAYGRSGALGVLGNGSSASGHSGLSQSGAAAVGSSGSLRGGGGSSGGGAKPRAEGSRRGSVSNGGSTKTTEHPNGSMSRLANGGNLGPSAASIALGLPTDDGHFRPLHEGSTVDAREFVRLTLQSLRDLGLESAAKALEQESGVTLEHPSINAFRGAVLTGDWRNAERLLLDGLMYSASRRPHSSVTVAVTAAQADGGKNGAPSASSSGVMNGVGHSAAPAHAPAVQIESVLRSPETRNWEYIKFLIQQQRYLELLEAKQTAKALSLLRRRLAPLNYGSERLQQLSSLVICASSEELREKAHWEGTGEASRRRLLREIEGAFAINGDFAFPSTTFSLKCALMITEAISPLVMLPSRRLSTLLQQAQTLQKHQDPFYNNPSNTHLSLYVDHRSNRSHFPSRSARVLEGHTDEVWDIAFSNDGLRLASGSRDRFVIIWRAGETFEIERKLGPHQDAVHCVAWSPDGELLVVTSDPDVTLWDVATGKSKRLTEHMYRVGAACWVPDGSGFITGGEDAKVVFWNRDGSVKRVWQTAPFRLIALDISADGKHLVAVAFRHSAPPQHAQGSVASNSNTYHTYHATSTSGAPMVDMSDVRSSLRSSTSPRSWSGTPSSISSNEADHNLATDLGGGSRSMGDERYKIVFFDLHRHVETGSIYMAEEMSSVKISEDSRYALINQRPNEARLWDIEHQSMVSRYFGHQMTKHIIRSCFGGVDKSFIISGSEDATIYMYHRASGRLLEKLEGHGPGCINSVAWHPTNAAILASCSDDRTVRIWGPGTSQSGYARIHSTSISTRPKVREERQDGSEDSSNGPTPFPWAMSPAPQAPGSPFFPTVQPSSDNEDDEAMEEAI
ncbi:WD40 repeat-like protein [Tilletiaria anomala UBC 951]|uniref:WD40 repeat-like protein n=1 Tax=Tilletiaria anomala (strain ATCC 24038 / CBS 436.72 / UBC 951) TaxID=1037660 RepID=A0A066WI16_TILAU|nr:WD40 repeat-like protein [Tilletiaria anomala UBC 951]KDN53451.1 WD40 repeat-like protein [Tilletiaria anomala UBC 951]